MLTLDKPFSLKGSQPSVGNLPVGVICLLNTHTIVVVESPFGSKDEWVREVNKAYCRAALRWCLLNGIVPLASHLLYTQMLDDQIPEERTLGIEAGLTVNKAGAKATLVFVDRGVSGGMELGIKRSLEEGRPVHALNLPGWA